MHIGIMTRPPEGGALEKGEARVARWQISKWRMNVSLRAAGVCWQSALHDAWDVATADPRECAHFCSASTDVWFLTGTSNPGSSSG